MGRMAKMMKRMMKGMLDDSYEGDHLMRLG